MVADHSGAFYTSETGIGFTCGTAGSAPEVSTTVRGALFLVMPPKQGVQWTFRPSNPLIEWASADAESWGLYLLS